MRKIVFDITVGRWHFTYANKIEIKRDVEALTETCNITLPRRLRLQGWDIFSGDGRIIKAGDPVTVKCGYKEAKTVFTGYVSRVSVDTPVVIECQDAMYLLKKANIQPKSWKTATVSDVVGYIAPQVGDTDLADMSLGTFRITNKPTAPTAARVLEYICSTYSLRAYFLRDVLHVGLAYATDGEQIYDYFFRPRSWSDAIITHNLKYNEADDVKIKVKAISIQRDNTRLEAEAGDTDGELRTVHYQNMTAAELKKAAEAAVDKLKVAGYTGSFTTFGEPVIQKADRVRLHSEDRPQGLYTVQAVIYTAGVGIGIRQEVTIGNKIG